jgi:hypothetical protein
MYLAYFDESGDSGLVNSPTTFFVLSCVLVHQSQWLASLDALIAMRRMIKEQHGISPRPEIKSTDIRRGRGPLLPLRWSLARRMQFFANLMRYQAVQLPALTFFSVAINKAPCAEKGREPRATAWEFAIQRLHRFSSDPAINDAVMVFPDEGHGLFIKRLMRRMRRYHRVPKRWGEGTFSIPTDRVIEDPNDRQSHDSYFTQLADWNAFAAHRSSFVDPLLGTDPGLWSLLGDRRLLAVNKLTGGPPGIVVWPA